MSSKTFKHIIFTLALLFSALSVGYSQFSIPDKVKGNVQLMPTAPLKTESTPFGLINDAYLRDLKRKERLKRNYLEMKHSLYFTQTSYNTNWASGGDNSFNGRVNSYIKHSFTNNDQKVNLVTEWDAAFGLGEKDDKLWKNEDRFKINTAFNYKLYGKLYYNVNADFRSQFANGYNQVDDTLRVSGFMAPATLNLALGLNYKLDDKRNITVSPLSGNLLFVRDQRLADLGSFGVEKGKRIRPNVGAMVRIQWTQPIFKDKSATAILSYRVDAQGFYDYKNVPTLNVQNWVDLTVFRYFSMNFFCNVIFDDQIPRLKEAATETTPAIYRSSFWQFSEVLGFGITYTFKNREK